MIKPMYQMMISSNRFASHRIASNRTKFLKIEIASNRIEMHQIESHRIVRYHVNVSFLNRIVVQCIEIVSNRQVRERYTPLPFMI